MGGGGEPVSSILEDNFEKDSSMDGGKQDFERDSCMGGGKPVSSVMEQGFERFLSGATIASRYLFQFLLN